MAPRRKKTVKDPKKAEEEKKARKAEPHVWIYGDPILNKIAYEFHPDLQEHIDKCYLAGQKSCRAMIFSEEYTIDFEKMMRTNGVDDQPIKRVLKSSVEAKKIRSVKGIEGTDYQKESGFVQEDKTCNICLSESTIPTRVESCGHIFCFMCLKANYVMGLECPTCRDDIDEEPVEEHTVRCDVDVEMDCPQEYIEELEEMFKTMDKNDKRKTPYGVSKRPGRSAKKYYWLFEAKKKGWFRYDPKNERYIEECYKRKKERFDMWICGSQVTIDFKEKVQERREYFGYTYRRRIRRIKASDLRKERVRGIAGIDTVAFPLPNL